MSINPQARIAIAGERSTSYTLPLSEEVRAELAVMQASLTAVYTRIFSPWTVPDRNPFPVITPCPRLAQAQRALTEAADRIQAAWEALRWGRPASDDRGDW